MQHQLLKMAYKRRRANSGTSSRAIASRRETPSRPQSLSRMSSVPRSIAQSSPRLPPLSQQNRISLRPSGFQPTASSSRDEDVIRAQNVETEDEILEREDLDALNEIVMAVEMKERGSIGCAYYIAREEKLCLMEDIKMAGLEVLDTLKIHVQPTVVLISTRCEEKLEEHLGKEARGIDRGDDASKYISSMA
jgi:DNA mismatch repair protein MSH5